MVISEFADKIDYQQAKEIITTINESHQVINNFIIIIFMLFILNLKRNNESSNKLVVSSLVGGAEIISAATKVALKNKEQIVDNILQDYMSLRLIALEEKVI